MNPVALVTGAGTGLGAALALALAHEGFDLALHYRSSEDGALETVEAILAHGCAAEIFQTDLGREAEALDLAESLNARFGRLDVLVNCAGPCQRREGLERGEAAWFEGLDATVTQSFFTTRAMLPLLRAGGPGRIVNIGSAGCGQPDAQDSAWSWRIGQGGVWTLTRLFADAEAGNGIAVNMVCAGRVENGTEAPDPPERFGKFHDFCQAVRFLAVEAPAGLTGSKLVLGGGGNMR